MQRSQGGENCCAVSIQLYARQRNVSQGHPEHLAIAETHSLQLISGLCFRSPYGTCRNTCSAGLAGWKQSLTNRSRWGFCHHFFVNWLLIVERITEVVSCLRLVRAATQTEQSASLAVFWDDQFPAHLHGLAALLRLLCGHCLTSKVGDEE